MPEGGWFKAPNDAAFDLPAKRLEAVDIAVLWCLMAHQDRKGEAWPSLDAVAGHLGVHKTTVKRSLARLKAAKYIEGRRRRRDTQTYGFPSVRGTTGAPSCLEGPPTVPQELRGTTHGPSSSQEGPPTVPLTAQEGPLVVPQELRGTTSGPQEGPLVVPDQDSLNKMYQVPGTWRNKHLTEEQAEEVLGTLREVPGWPSDDKADLRMLSILANQYQSADVLQWAASDLVLNGGEGKDGKPYRDLRRAYQAFVRTLFERKAKEKPATGEEEEPTWEELNRQTQEMIRERVLFAQAKGTAQHAEARTSAPAVSGS